MVVDVGVWVAVDVEVDVGVGVGVAVAVGGTVGVAVASAVGVGVGVGPNGPPTGASATPRKAVLVVAVTRAVTVPENVPPYPLASVILTSCPPPAAPVPPLRVA